MPFDGSSRTDSETALPFAQENYFQLVDTIDNCPERESVKRPTGVFCLLWRFCFLDNLFVWRA